MQPIASSMAVRRTREHVQSALPDAPVVPEPSDPPARARSARSQRMLVKVLRRLATTTGGLADRLDRPVGAD
jgi:hypothetical protein